MTSQQLTTRQFNDLAAVVIYHFCDVQYKKRAERAAKRLAEQGIIADVDDGETAYDKYEEAVKEYALDKLPAGYDVRHDYWGAKTITNDKGWNAPKTGLFSGDSSGRIMLFDSYKALEQYTQEKLQEIG